MKTIDARGLSCPQPVLLTKQAADRGEREITVLVDNACAQGNISRFAQHAGFTLEIGESGDHTVLTLKK